MHTTVKDIMTTDVAAVGRRTPFKEIVELMHRRHVSAVPVLDSTGQVRGVVSQSDLLLKETDPDAHETFHLSHERRDEEHKATADMACDLMTSPAVTVLATTTVEEAAGYMRRHKIGRLPVVEPLTGRLIGIVSRADVLSVYRRPDEQIRQDVLNQVIGREFAMNPERFDVTVTDGRVTLTGKTERSSQIPLLMRAIRHLEGVVSAQDRLGYRTDDTYIPFHQYY